MYEFCNKNIIKFILLLRKVVHPYKYMDKWEKFNETSLSDKEYFYGNLSIEEVTDADYKACKKVSKEFKRKNLGECHDLCVQSDTLLLADVFGNFRKNVLEHMNLIVLIFLSEPGLAWQAYLKNRNRIRTINWYWYLLIVEKGIRGKICHAINRNATTSNKYMKEDNKDKESSYIMYLDANNLYGWGMPQKLPVDRFRWEKNV